MIIPDKNAARFWPEISSVRIEKNQSKIVFSRAKFPGSE
jgi:hypothetical protein